MDSENLVYEERDRCAWLTMNRPQVLNALSKGMFRELAQGLARARKNKNVRYVAFTGSGNSFSAGLDIKQVGSFESTKVAREFVYKLVKPFWREMLDCEKPVLAVVNGPAYGAGAEIALLSDIVIASERSKFAFSGGRLGALCCVSGIVGPPLMSGRKVVEMNLTGNPLSAEEAREAGLATYVVPEGNLMEKVGEVLQDLDRVSPISNSAFKRIKRGTIPNRALDVAYRELLRTITSSEFKIGAAAFAAKQPPKF